MAENKKVDLKTFGQRNLHRIMLEKKSERAKALTEKVNSPLAKYDSSGNLTCVLCKVSIKSAIVWKVHVNSKVHKQKVEATKQLKGQILNAPRSTCVSYDKPKVIKTPAEELKKSQNIPTLETNVRKDIPLVEPQKSNRTVDIADAAKDSLPEKFFDDPVKDAKIRNAEYKNPQDEEWERFQREIKEESSLSSAIISVEQDGAAVERQIKEIDEQMERWAKVIDFEKKKSLVSEEAKQKIRKACDIHDNDIASSEESDGFDEFCNWRSKKF